MWMQKYNSIFYFLSAVSPHLLLYSINAAPMNGRKWLAVLSLSDVARLFALNDDDTAPLLDLVPCSKKRDMWTVLALACLLPCLLLFTLVYESVCTLATGARKSQRGVPYISVKQRACSSVLWHDLQRQLAAVLFLLIDMHAHGPW